MDDFSVLVVDDETDFVDTMLKQLKRRGVECAGAYDGRDALEKMKESGYDVVLLDMNLADEDGNNVLREVKKMAPETEIVILSGYASARAGREGLDYGASDYLIKPVEFDTLYEKLAAAHKNRINVA